MTEKAIKNEQWTVRQLMSKIDNSDINKPRYQRKKKWDNLPKKDSTPNEQSYINFLFETENSVHAITFGQETTQEGINFSNIDGNNRINAIKHFMDAPFELVPYCLDELFNFIHSLNLDIDTKTLLEQIFTRLSYMEIMNFKYHRYFIENGYEELYNEKLKIHRDEFEQPIDDIQEQLKVNKKERFDTNVKINVNLFEGYTTDELCKTFESINKYNSKLKDRYKLIKSPTTEEREKFIYGKTDLIYYYQNTKANSKKPLYISLFTQKSMGGKRSIYIGYFSKDYFEKTILSAQRKQKKKDDDL